MRRCGAPILRAPPSRPPAPATPPVGQQPGRDGDCRRLGRPTQRAPPRVTPPPAPARARPLAPAPARKQPTAARTVPQPEMGHLGVPRPDVLRPGAPSAGSSGQASLARAWSARGGNTGRRFRWSGPGTDRARDPQEFGAVVSKWLSSRGSKEDLARATLFGRWAEVVGADIAAHAVPVSLVDGELLLRAESTAWATQLRMLGLHTPAADQRSRRPRHGRQGAGAGAHGSELAVRQPDRARSGSARHLRVALTGHLGPHRRRPLGVPMPSVGPWDRARDINPARVVPTTAVSGVDNGRSGAVGAVGLVRRHP